jgi:aryl-alcohol dehydrogenase-like predicted oxidoreductase
MESRTLDGLTVSRLCLGTMTFGAQVDERAAADMLDLALERGIDFVDTANAYNAGRTEEILGRLLAGRRDRVVLASKVGIPTGEEPDGRALSRRAIRSGVEATLRRLRTDHLDLYYLHQPDHGTPVEESLAEMEALVMEGKVRRVGASNYAAWQVCRMRCVAGREGRRPVSFVQPVYNLLARGIEAELVPMCRELGLPLVTYNPLAGGLLTGKHTAAEPPAGTRFEHMPAYRDRYWHPANHAAVRELRSAADAAGRSLVGLAFSWLLHHSPADSVIVGASSVGQLEQNLAAAEEGPLPGEAVAACDEVWARLRGPAPRYHR